jgi:hypothetical protein
MNDAFWSPEQSVRNYVFVSLSTQKHVGKSVVQDPHKLWWLRMNDRFDEIEAAGPLKCPVAVGAAVERVVERFPAIAVDGERKLSLVYMSRPTPQGRWGLHSVRLEQDPGTGAPSLPPGEKAPHALAEGLATEPLVVSADGQRVFARGIAGELITAEIADAR